MYFYTFALVVFIYKRVLLLPFQNISPTAHDLTASGRKRIHMLTKKYNHQNISVVQIQYSNVTEWWCEVERDFSCGYWWTAENKSHIIFK